MSAKIRHLKVKISKIKTKFENLSRKNCLNSSSNDRIKSRILWTIQQNSIKDTNQRQNGEQEQKRRHLKEKFRKFRKNLRILGEKIVWIRVQMTGEYAEFDGQFNSIWLKNSIEM